MAQDLCELAEAITWRRSYDRLSVERFLTAAEAERARLLLELEKARRASGGADPEGVERQLGARVLAAHREIAKARRHNDQVVAAIIGDAEAEAAVIVRAAALAVRSGRPECGIGVSATPARPPGVESDAPPTCRR